VEAEAWGRRRAPVSGGGWEARVGRGMDGAMSVVDAWQESGHSWGRAGRGGGGDEQESERGLWQAGERGWPARHACVGRRRG
jgi:hypothetical protein